MPRDQRRKRRDAQRIEGGGPWQFDSPALDPDEAWTLDFRNMTYNGQTGWFRRWLPLSYAQITNLDAGNALTVEYNGQFQDFVVPNAVESFDNQGITRLSVRNEGADAIAAGDVKVSVGREPYGADDAARERARGGPVWSPKQAIADLIPGFRGGP